MNIEAGRIGTENWNKWELEAIKVELQAKNNKEHDPQNMYLSLFPQIEKDKLSFALL